MSRTLVTLREADISDAPFLAELWSEALRRADMVEQLDDMEQIIRRVEQSPEQRLTIAEYDGERAGGVYLRVSTLTPLNLEPTVQALSPHVVSGFRRKGVGRQLMDAAVCFAEELGIAHVTTAASSGSRDANRFMARLGFGPQAMLRVAATHAVRAKLTAQLPHSQRIPGGRPQLGQVMAARRSMRRSGQSVALDDARG